MALGADLLAGIDDNSLYNNRDNKDWDQVSEETRVAAIVLGAPVAAVGTGDVAIIKLETRFFVGNDNHGGGDADGDEIAQLLPDKNVVLD
jgi:hypothetical protein